jgi:hypothetical protein
MLEAAAREAWLIMVVLARIRGLARLELVAFYDDVEKASTEATRLSQYDPDLAYRVFAPGGRPVFMAVGGRGEWCRRSSDAFRGSA